MKYLSIGETALLFGVSTKTLRMWHKLGKFFPEYRTLGLHRRYSINQIKLLINPNYEIKNKKNIVYSRVSSHGQKKDLLEITTVFSSRLYGSRSNKLNRMLSKFPYAIFEELIISKTTRKGIKLKQINPAYTSQIRFNKIF